MNKNKFKKKIFKNKTVITLYLYNKKKHFVNKQKISY